MTQETLACVKTTITTIDMRSHSMMCSCTSDDVDDADDDADDNDDDDE